MERVASSAYQWTGVAVSREGRIFVNYPTWDDHPAYKVAELVQGSAKAYPDMQANDQFICVQSVVVDGKNRLWILDPAKLRGKAVDASGATLFQVDLQRNRIGKTYVFPSSVALPQSYLNDVRIDTVRDYAYMTDSGLGGIVVLNLKTGDSWRALTDMPEVKANLKEINFKSTGPSSRLSQSDGIELAEQGDLLYFTALGGDILYAVPTAVLRDRTMTAEQRRSSISVVSRHNVPTDGMLLRQGKLYMADLPEEGLWEFDLQSRTGRLLETGVPIRWADSFAMAPDGSVYFTTSQINYPKEKREKYGLYRLF